MESGMCKGPVAETYLATQGGQAGGGGIGEAGWWATSLEGQSGVNIFV